MCRYILKFGAALLLAGAVFAAGCARKSDGGTVVASVNGRPIYLREVSRELSNMVRQDPSLAINDETVDSLLDMLIKRQIIIQAAMDKKMAEERKFADTIKAFWEQTLIRDFVERKSEEFDRYVFITDKETEAYYNELKQKTGNIKPFGEMREKLELALMRKKKSKAFEGWLAEKRESAKIEIDMTRLADITK